MEKFICELLINNNCTLQESTVDVKSAYEFWHSVVLDNSQNPISGGFGNNKMAARKIAIAEYLERHFFRNLLNSSKEIQTEWGLDIIPTACGFAAGFNSENTVLRSVNEAIERWVMSKWIDDNFALEEVGLEFIKPKLDPAALFFIEQFDEVLFFKKKVIVMIQDNPMQVTVAKTMGLTSTGIFPGSSAQISCGNIWNHALLESFRHLLAVRNNPVRKNVFPDNKVRFFAENKNIGLKQIKAASNRNWPLPQITFHNSESLLGGQYFIARTIISGWKTWSDGPIERFLF
jgi:ribosomal protein S12 methylthiotransferase accessory factor YcaO